MGRRLEYEVKTSVRLNMSNPQHVKINDVIQNLDPKIFKSKNQFIIDAIQFYIDNYGKETFVIKKKEKERAEYIRSEDIDDIKETAKCQAGGMITTQQNLQNHLNDGSITQEEYNAYYPYDGMEGSYYSVFVETDLNKASTIDGQRLSSEDAIAEYIASMLLLETDPVFYISYDGVYTTGGTDYYEFRCHR